MRTTIVNPIEEMQERTTLITNIREQDQHLVELATANSRLFGRFNYDNKLHDDKVSQYFSTIEALKLVEQYMLSYNDRKEVISI